MINMVRCPACNNSRPHAAAGAAQCVVCGATLQLEQSEPGELSATLIKAPARPSVVCGHCAGKGSKPLSDDLWATLFAVPISDSISASRVGQLLDIEPTTALQRLKVLYGLGFLVRIELAPLRHAWRRVGG